MTIVEEYHVNYYRVGITILQSAHNSVKTTKNNFLKHCKALTYSQCLILLKINVKVHNVVLIATDELRFLFRKTTSIMLLHWSMETDWRLQKPWYSISRASAHIAAFRWVQCSFVALEAECQVVWRGEQHHYFGNSQHLLVLLINN